MGRCIVGKKLVQFRVINYFVTLLKNLDLSVIPSIKSFAQMTLGFDRTVVSLELESKEAKP